MGVNESFAVLCPAVAATPADPGAPTGVRGHHHIVWQWMKVWLQAPLPSCPGLNVGPTDPPAKSEFLENGNGSEKSSTGWVSPSFPGSSVDADSVCAHIAVLMSLLDAFLP